MSGKTSWTRRSVPWATTSDREPHGCAPLSRETRHITTIQGCVRPSRGSAAWHWRSYGRICTSRRARLHAHDCVATEIMCLLAQLHDGNVQIPQVSRHYAQQPLRLVGPEAASLGVVGDVVERVYGLVVVVAPGARGIPAASSTGGSRRSVARRPPRQRMR